MNASPNTPPRGIRLPSVIAVFGSFARGDGLRDSDIDLLAVIPDEADPAVWDRRLGDLGLAITRWTGNQARLITYTPDDLRQGVNSSVPFLDELRRDAVTAAGTSIHDLLAAAVAR
ncbi:MAG: nucleotidyltransferase domain-containing protein [Nitriliruptorales bacterium]